jgi:hypothetical protein
MEDNHNGIFEEKYSHLNDSFLGLMLNKLISSEIFPRLRMKNSS